MVIFHFSMQVEDIMEHLVASVMCYILVCKRKIFLRILMSSVLHFNMQEEGILEHTNAKCHLCALLVNFM